MRAGDQGTGDECSVISGSSGTSFRIDMFEESGSKRCVRPAPKLAQELSFWETANNATRSSPGYGYCVRFSFLRNDICVFLLFTSVRLLRFPADTVVPQLMGVVRLIHFRRNVEPRLSSASVVRHGASPSSSYSLVLLPSHVGITWEVDQPAGSSGDCVAAVISDFGWRRRRCETEPESKRVGAVCRRDTEPIARSLELGGGEHTTPSDALKLWCFRGGLFAGVASNIPRTWAPLVGPSSRPLTHLRLL